MCFVPQWLTVASSLHQSMDASGALGQLFRIQKLFIAILDTVWLVLEKGSVWRMEVGLENNLCAKVIKIHGKILVSHLHLLPYSQTSHLRTRC